MTNNPLKVHRIQNLFEVQDVFLIRTNTVWKVLIQFGCTHMKTNGLRATNLIAIRQKEILWTKMLLIMKRWWMKLIPNKEQKISLIISSQGYPQFLGKKFLFFYFLIRSNIILTWNNELNNLLKTYMSLYILHFFPFSSETVTEATTDFNRKSPLFLGSMTTVNPLGKKIETTEL